MKCIRKSISNRLSTKTRQKGEVYDSKILNSSTFDGKCYIFGEQDEIRLSAALRAANMTSLPSSLKAQHFPFNVVLFRAKRLDGAVRRELADFLIYLNPKGENMAITFDDAFPKRYLRADNVAQPLTMEILRVVSETAYGETKYIVHFNEDPRGLKLNRTLFPQIVKITDCEDAEEWCGHRITLFRDVAQVNGKTIHTIGARRPQNQQVSKLLIRKR